MNEASEKLNPETVSTPSGGSACCGAKVVRAPDLDGWMCEKCCHPQPPTREQQLETAGRMVLARLEELWGASYWTETPPSTDLQEAAQKLARLITPNGPS